MPEEWKTSVVIPIFKGKEVVMDCGAYKEVKLLEYAMKTLERVLENRIRWCAIWLYACERHNSCIVYFVKDTRGIP